MKTSVRIAQPEETLPLDASSTNIVDGRAEQMKPTTSAIATKRPMNWAWLWAVGAYLLWHLLTKIVLSVVYLTLIADGMRQLIPPLGLKLYKALPGLSFLQDYEATHRLDIAQPAALVLMVFVWIAWGKVLRHWLTEEKPQHEDALPQKAGDINAVLATVLLIGDGCLFYISLVRVSWNGTTWSASALLATIVYSAVVVFAVLHSMSLHRKCVDLKYKEKTP